MTKHILLLFLMVTLGCGGSCTNTKKHFTNPDWILGVWDITDTEEARIFETFIFTQDSCIGVSYSGSKHDLLKSKQKKGFTVTQHVKSATQFEIKLTSEDGKEVNTAIFTKVSDTEIIYSNNKLNISNTRYLKRE